MKCLCPKCGRKNDVSAAELKLQRGTVVCPRCLTTYKVDVPAEKEEDTPPPLPKKKPKATPAPDPTTKKTSTTTTTRKSPTTTTTRPSTPARFCNKCGATIPAGRVTCPECGSRVAARSISFVETPTPSTPQRPARQPRTAQKPATQSRKKPAQQQQPSGWKKIMANMTAAGCLVWTIGIVCIFFLFYALIGILFQ